jgi:hypothetical protein
MSWHQIAEILRQGKDLGTVEWIYFEGGEPFLYYPILLKGVKEASQLGFKVGLVTNSYWATEVEDAREWLQPMAEHIRDLSISNDLYHWSEPQTQMVENARLAAEDLDIPIGFISVAQPEAVDKPSALGQLPAGDSKVMYRGRAAKKLATRAHLTPWAQFTTCPYEDLEEPGRVHIDPFGYLHICQGIVLGNLFDEPLNLICKSYNPKNHPITGPLLDGGPAALVNQNNLPHQEKYADACHLCYDARQKMRAIFPAILQPDQMYGVNGLEDVG